MKRPLADRLKSMCYQTILRTVVIVAILGGILIGGQLLNSYKNPADVWIEFQSDEFQHMLLIVLAGVTTWQLIARFVEEVILDRPIEWADQSYEEIDELGRRGRRRRRGGLP